MDRIDRLRSEYEAALLRTEGVVGVSSIVDDAGGARLRILTSQPTADVEARLPDAVRPHAVLVYVGAIDAQ